MEKTLPINSKVLKWSRESIGLSLSDVAKKMKKSIDVVESWEEGKSSPTYPQLEKLAYDILKRPVAVFFFPEKRISELADKYCVSREVILRNYFDRNLINEEYYRKMTEKWIF